MSEVHNYVPNAQAHGECSICGHSRWQLWHYGEVYKVDHDGFVGSVIGGYTTREGKSGVVLQQLGTKVVHVYSRKWWEK